MTVKQNIFKQEFVKVSLLIKRLQESEIEGIKMEYISKDYLMDIINDLCETHIVEADLNIPKGN